MDQLLDSGFAQAFIWRCYCDQWKDEYGQNQATEAENGKRQPGTKKAPDIVQSMQHCDDTTSCGQYRTMTTLSRFSPETV